jgi:hypothetical protein
MYEIHGISNAALTVILVSVVVFQYLVDKFTWFSFLATLTALVACGVAAVAWLVKALR